MANCAIVGINWGDEGKGRMVDLLTEDYDVVVRFQGGGNAGHTVINEFGKFALHLLPSGIFRPGVVNILGNGVALDPENLWVEMQVPLKMLFGITALLPATMITAIVSPMARPTPKITPAKIPCFAAGITAKNTLLSWVAPSAREPS